MGINHHVIHKDPSLRQTLCTSWELVPHLVFRARSGFTSVLCSVGLYMLTATGGHIQRGVYSE